MQSNQANHVIVGNSPNLVQYDTSLALLAGADLGFAVGRG